MDSDQRKEEQMVNSYEDLLVWQKSMSLVEEVYKLTKFLPNDETGFILPSELSSILEDLIFSTAFLNVYEFSCGV